MSEDRVVHIIPVGFEVDRVLYGLIELAAKKIYFLFDDKKDKWGKESRNYLKQVKEKLSIFNFNNKNIIELGFDPTRYNSCENIIKKIIFKEVNAKIYINVSTSTKLCAIASTVQAMDHENILLYYVVPEKYNLPPEGLPFSSGAKRMEIFTPRGFDIGNIEEKILEALEKRDYKNLRDLNEEIFPSDMSKSSRAKLSYYLRKLQRGGFLTYLPSKQISITSIGKNRVNPITDDAEYVIIDR